MLGADLEAKWTWPLPTKDQTQVPREDVRGGVVVGVFGLPVNYQKHVPGPACLVDILPAEGDNPATIVVWAGRSVYGLSAANGRPRWRGEMLDFPPSNLHNDIDPHIDRVLLRDRTQGLPRLLAGNSCRLTWPADEQGRYQPPRGEPLTYAPLDEPVPTRPLPWAPGGDQYRGILLVLWMVPWSLVWFVVPVLLIRWAMKRNSWRLAFVPALYQLAMTLSLKVIPMSWLPFNTSESQNWDPHVGICFLSGVFLIVHGAWMIRRRRLWVLVDASAVYAIAIALGWAKRGPQVADAADMGAVLHIEVPASVMILLPAVGCAIFGGHCRGANGPDLAPPGPADSLWHFFSGVSCAFGRVDDAAEIRGEDRRSFPSDAGSDRAHAVSRRRRIAPHRRNCLQCHVGATAAVASPEAFHRGLTGAGGLDRQAAMAEGCNENGRRRAVLD